MNNMQNEDNSQLFSHVLMEMNGMERKRVPKRKRGDDVVGLEDKSVQFVLKKNKITTVDENQISG